MTRRPLPRDKLVAPREVSRRLNISILAINGWRRGSARRRPLPVAYGRAGNAKRIWIMEAELSAWLKTFRPDLWNVWQYQQKILAGLI